ncbi:MAG: GAF domain-containing protein [Acidobacteriota bacterium]|nr:GAF domain-containing protein [Acidobacteriota bacterium]MDQ5873022.1 GAF domain-containing protein [Acidobacteriota bacterium]
MLQVLFESDGRSQVYTLAGQQASIGRSSDNDIVLNDFSVSRRHAFLKHEGGEWVLYDNHSTNGIRVNDRHVPNAPVASGDRAVIGTFNLKFREEPVEVTPEPRRLVDSTSTCIRPIAEFNQDFGLEKAVAVPLSDSTADRKRVVLDVAYKNKVFEILVQVAKTLISLDDLETVLDKVMDLIFEYLPVDRGFLLLEEDDELQLRISRFKSGQRMTTDGSLPYSRTIVDMVVREKVAVLTSDAQQDERFEAGQSIRIQQIRSAMCAPLWYRDTVIGVIHVDSPLHVGTFTERDLDLLTALANFAAVAIERARLHDRVAEEKRIRGRLERYHSPQVVDEIIADAKATGSFEEVRTETVTILFADLVGFTSWSEKMAPTDLARLLNRFFTLASDAVFSQDGTIDKFVGDAVMAFFGAPIDQPDHAARSVAAALKLREEVALWNLDRAAHGELPLEVRMALNTGETIVGEIGSERRVEYTVVGNAVNVAARMEEFVAMPGDIVIGPATYEAIRDRYRFAQLGFFALKGVSEQVPLYKLLGELTTPELAADAPKEALSPKS